MIMEIQRSAKSVFDSVALGNITALNRLVRSATWEGMADDDGRVTDRLVNVYRELGAGGVGTVVTGVSYVLPEGKGIPGMLSASDDADIPGLSRIAEAVHEGGAKAFLQIAYGGTQSRIGVDERTWSPSGIAELSTGSAGHEMSAEEIKSLIRAFADAAKRASAAGFDGVQIHAAHGYLLSQFLSPLQNRRTDGYGGTPENRGRIVSEIISLIKNENPSLTVIIKINGSDQIDGGLTLRDCEEVCRMLDMSGIDGIEVSGGVAAAGAKAAIRGGIRTADDEGYFFDDASAIADAVAVPVMSVGGYRSPDVMDGKLNGSNVAMFSMSRPFLAEPDLANRWRSGDRTKAKCVSCGGCRTPEGTRCTVFR